MSEKEWLYKAGLVNELRAEWMFEEEGFTNVQAAIDDLRERLEAWGFVVDNGNRVVVRRFVRPEETDVELTEEQQEACEKLLHH